MVGKFDLSSVHVPEMTESTTKWLRELKDKVAAVHGLRTTLCRSVMLHNLEQKICVTDEEKVVFAQKVYCPYLQRITDHINGRVEPIDLFSSMSTFDPCHLPDKEDELSNYGMEKMTTLINFYGIAQRV